MNKTGIFFLSQSIFEGEEVIFIGVILDKKKPDRKSGKIKFDFITILK